MATPQWEDQCEHTPCKSMVWLSIIGRELAR